MPSAPRRLCGVSEMRDRMRGGQPYRADDPVLRADLWSLFHEMAATGTTLLVSSHVMDEATRCERVLLMREGVLVADNTPGGLLADTGEADMEAAFLQLARRQGEEARS